MSNIHTLTDHVKVAGSISPQSSGANNTEEGAWVDMKGARRITYLVLIGDAANGNIDAKIEQASADDGTGKKDVTGAALEQIAGDAATNDNKVHAITLSADLLDDGFNYVRISITNVAVTLIAAVGIVYRMHRLPAPDKGLVQDVRKVL